MSMRKAIPSRRFSTQPWYADPLALPRTRTTDVYIANYVEGITEYRQKRNVAIHSCTIPATVGVAEKGGQSSSRSTAFRAGIAESSSLRTG